MLIERFRFLAVLVCLCALPTVAMEFGRSPMDNKSIHDIPLLSKKHFTENRQQLRFNSSSVSDAHSTVNAQDAGSEWIQFQVVRRRDRHLGR
jgi:hypothetical protein